MVTKYSRTKLIDICERAIVHKRNWDDRDSSDAILQVGKAWALLKAGCEFTILTKSSLKTTEDTIWIEISYTDFSGFENDVDDNRKTNFYLPTESRLEENKGKDWY